MLTNKFQSTSYTIKSVPILQNHLFYKTLVVLSSDLTARSMIYHSVVPVLLPLCMFFFHSYSYDLMSYHVSIQCDTCTSISQPLQTNKTFFFQTFVPIGNIENFPPVFDLDSMGFIVPENFNTSKTWIIMWTMHSLTN